MFPTVLAWRKTKRSFFVIQSRIHFNELWEIDHILRQAIKHEKIQQFTFMGQTESKFRHIFFYITIRFDYCSNILVFALASWMEEKPSKLPETRPYEKFNASNESFSHSWLCFKVFVIFSTFFIAFKPAFFINCFVYGWVELRWGEVSVAPLVLGASKVIATLNLYKKWNKN